MIVNSGGASTNNEVVINPNLIMNCDLQKGIISTKDTYLSLEGGASKTGSGEFTKFWKYEYKTGTNDSCSASINWETYIGLGLYNNSTSFNGESIEATLPDGSTSWKYVYTLGDHYFEGAYISATGTVQSYYSCRGKVVTLSALLQGRVKVQLLGTDDVLIGELPEVAWEDRYNRVLKTAQFTVPADCTKLSVKVICEPSYRIYETDNIGNTNYEDDTSPGMYVYGLKLELGDTQTLCDADGKLLPQPQDSYEMAAERRVAYIFQSESPSNYASSYYFRRYGKTTLSVYDSDAGGYIDKSIDGGIIIGNNTNISSISSSPITKYPTSIIIGEGQNYSYGGVVIGRGVAGTDIDTLDYYSIAIAQGTAKNGGVAIGYDTIADGQDSIAIGRDGRADKFSISIGGGTAQPITSRYGSMAVGGGIVTGDGSLLLTPPGQFSSGNFIQVSADDAWLLGRGKVSGQFSGCIGVGNNGPDVSGEFALGIGFGQNGGWVEANADSSCVIGNYCCISAAEGQIVLGECNAQSTATTDKFIFGGGGTYQARKNCFRITTNSGTYAVGSYHTSGADYAEMFEWFDGNPDDEDRAGRFVVLNGDKLQFAQPDDEDILGIVSGNASVIGDVFDDAWQGQWMTDIFGRPIMEEVEEEYPVQLPDGTTEMKSHTVIRQKLNPEWDPDMEYVPRGKRKEWDAVGLVGKLVAIDDGTCEVNGYATVDVDGTATKSVNRTSYRVMKRLDETHIQIFIK